MAGGIDTRCLYSTVKNTSGVRRKFAFLPPHGRELEAGEELTVFGDIKEAIIRHERTEGRRNIVAFERAIVRGDLDIINTPATILTDDANPGASPKAIRLHNGTIGTIDPCWTGSTSLGTTYG